MDFMTIGVVFLASPLGADIEFSSLIDFEFLE
jgi:hypothetical protein